MNRQTAIAFELRMVRLWILVVGIAAFGFGMLLTQLVMRDRILDEWRVRYAILYSVMLAAMIVLTFVAKARPVAACVLALVVYWGLELGFTLWAGELRELFTTGILAKVMITGALIMALRSANHVTRLRRLRSPV
ncbi:MAG: hypothetical protein QM831_42410 [Kofleriaceae bacterium]